jgi:hypothetical protein
MPDPGRRAAANAVRLRKLHAPQNSVYALIIGHWSAWQASRAETNDNN